MSSKLPLCVDVDGTLVYTDTMVEAIIACVKENPFILFSFPAWWKKGKPYFKRQISEHVSLDPTLLPYNNPFIHWLRSERASGRTLILISGSDKKVVEQINKHLGLFSQVIATDGTVNMTGQTKADTLTKLFGHKQFSYAGNSQADLAVWPSAGTAIIVNAPKGIASQAKTLAPVENIFPPRPLTISIIARAIRIHQWVKNLLLFIPAIAGHRLNDPAIISHSLIGFFSFSFMASAIYLMNDLFDIEADRRHQTKRHRPIAAGTLNPLTAIKICIALMGTSLILAAFLPPAFYGILAAYVLINLAYSSYLKQVRLADVIVLASLYVLRIFAGSFATNVATSSWLFIFVLFLFSSLALVKRCAELTNLIQQNKTKAHGRGYTSHDRLPLMAIGVSTAAMAAAILAFYLGSDQVSYLYAAPHLLWFSLPLLIFWLARIWLLTYQGKLHEDPIVFAIKDPVSYIVCAAVLLLATIAT